MPKPKYRIDRMPAPPPSFVISVERPDGEFEEFCHGHIAQIDDWADVLKDKYELVSDARAVAASA